MRSIQSVGRLVRDVKAAGRTRRAAARLLVEPLEGRVLLAATLPAGFTESLVATGLASPTAMEFAPDGRVFVAQQDGALRVIQDGRLLDAPFVTLPADSVGERGLLGVVADPNFAATKYLYVYYTTAAGTGESHNRVSRFTAVGNTASLASETVILDLPAVGGGAWHMGGAMRFGLDGKLYVAVGDYEFPAYAQQMTTPAGKLLRINPDGSIPTDNPFYASTIGVNKAIWALGLRNPFTLAVQPGTGRMYIADVGQSAFEEVDEGAAGANYGWPLSEGPATLAGQTAPVYAYDHTLGISIIGGAFYPAGGGKFPAQYAGQYFFGDFGGGYIKTLDPVTKVASAFGTKMSFITGVAAGSDGAIWYLSRGAASGGGTPNTGSVYRIAYDAFQPPKVNAQPADLVVPVGESATFTVSASGAGTVAYQWSRNGVNIAGATTSTYKLATTALTDTGATFACAISNAYGNVTTRSAVLTVTTNKRPTATILTPAAGTTAAGGQTISYSASATDAEDGALPASAFTWQVNYYTGIVARPLVLPTSGSKTGSFVVPSESPYTEANVYFRITLTVTDSAGLAYTTFTDVLPRTAVVTLTTNVPGAKVEIDGQPKASPYVTTGVEGLKRTIGAPPVQVINGETWQFDRWSDGGAATHAIAFPGTATTFTATYRKRQVVYLSDLPFVGTPTNKWGPVERDLSNGENLQGDGKPITLNGTIYPKGFGVHADSEIVIDLGGKYESFLSDVGLDDEVGNAGTVDFQVWVDGAKLYDSGLMIGETPAKTANVDVRGKSQLRLVASTGGDDGTLDHADWAGARLVVPETPATVATAGPVYVSDLPFLGTPTNGWGPVERDRGNGQSAAGDGAAITLDGVTYAKGLGTHANAEVNFDLAGAYATFRADVGIDDEEGVNGSAAFQLWADGVKVYDSGTMYGSTPAKRVDVSVLGVRRLALVTTDAGDNNYNDHADWAGAVLVPAIVYASDLPFAGTNFNGWGPAERDRSNGENAAGDGTAITLAGAAYAKGIGTHAASEVGLDLFGKYASFKADVGIDDESGDRGTAVFQLWADGVMIYDSGIVTGAMAAKSVDVSVAGVQHLSLVATDAGDGNYNDHADWANARLVPAAVATAPPSPPVVTPVVPTATVADVRVVEGNAGTTNLVFAVTRSSAESASAVAYATADGTATVANGDYAAASGTLTFAAGELTKTVAVAVFGDARVEADETLRLALSAPTNLTLAVAAATGTILNDDFAAVAIADASVNEGSIGATDLTFVVTRSDATLASAVSWATADGTAAAASDYAAASGTLAFAVGEASKTIVVKVIGDAVVEANETVLVNLSGATGATIARGQAVGTIVNDDAVGTVSVADAATVEGNGGTQLLAFTVTRSTGVGTASVQWATADGTAAAGDADYLAASGTVTFAANETTKTVNVTINGDAKAEANETLVVNLLNPTNLAVARGQAVGTITNDDTATLSVADASVTEGNAGTTDLTFVVTRTASALASTVNWATADGTATAGSDYAAASGTLAFAAGETSKTIVVKVTGDVAVEANETVLVNLSGASSATVSRAQATGAIVNDDLVSFSVGDASVVEGNSGTRVLAFTVTRSSGAGTGSVQWATANGTANTADADYVAAGGTVSFAAGETSKAVSVTVTGDARVEADETFFVNLSSPVSGVVARAQAVGTIVNDDVAPVTLQAESAALKNVTVGNAGSGYTGTGYAAFRFLGAAGDSITWSPTAAAAGTRTLQFRYATGTSLATPSIKLVVNGVTVSAAVAFSVTGGTSTWRVATVSVSLAAGVNSVALVASNTYFTLNVDSLTIG
jgi:glucose/arabinose dehydrogenase